MYPGLCQAQPDRFPEQAGSRADGRPVGWDQMFLSAAKRAAGWDVCAQLSTSAGSGCAPSARELWAQGKEDGREDILGSNNSQGVEGCVEECPEGAQ